MGEIRHRSWLRTQVEVFGARRRGRRDGRVNLPAPFEAEIHPGELIAIKNRGEQRLDSIEQRWKGEDARLLGEYRRKGQELKASQDELILAINETEDDIGAVPAEAASASSADRANDEPPTRSRRVTTRVDRRVALAAAIIIGIAEIPLNGVAFRVFGESEILTWVLSLAVALGVPVAAHVLGVTLAKPRSERSPTERVFVRSLTIVPPVLFVAIALVRTRYLDVFEGGFQGLSPVLAVVAFTSLNLFAYLVVTVLSFLSHDPDEVQGRRDDRQRRREHREMTRRRRRNRQRGAKRVARVKASIEARARRVRDLRGRVRHLEQEWVTARTTRQKRAEAYLSVINAERSFFQRLMALYVAENVRHRDDHVAPKVLHRLPDLAVPPTFLDGIVHLDWDDEPRLADAPPNAEEPWTISDATRA